MDFGAECSHDRAVGSETTEGEPLRLDGELHPVPFVFAILFSCLTLIGLALALFGDGLVVGVVVSLIFGTLAVLFALECIPPWVELDDSGIRYREKLRTDRVSYDEIQALGTGLENAEHPGSLLVRLTEDACRRRGILRRDAMFHISIPAVPICRQNELLEIAVERWKDSGGAGTTFSLIEEFFETGATLRKASQDLLELQRQANPVTAAGEATSSDDDIYCSILHVRNDSGGLFFCIVAGGDRLDALVITIRDTAERLLREHRFNPEFSREIQVSLVPDLTPDTPALKARMDELVTSLAGDPRRALRISWAHGRPEPNS